jgi:DNA-directed RNA polymerase specialized sigma24 family protein
MQEKSDVELLREYAQDGNEAAFREIVVRHTDLIYSSALRQMASPDLAQDVAQGVFSDLARKARPLANSLEQNASLLGWLFRSTPFAALNQLRDDRRRQARESHCHDCSAKNTHHRRLGRRRHGYFPGAPSRDPA